ncbi:MAG: holo-ACP synthase [Thermoanaerobaculales bacterium]|nr:holo-ACP synthase [Thermoanaerobaculales bacterium]
MGPLPDDPGGHRAQGSVLMIALGCDIVSVRRIAAAVERHGDRFMQRCFRPDEIALARRRGDGEAATLAARWAAKEAFVKALGAFAHGVPYRDIEVVRDGDGTPGIILHGTASDAFASTGAGSILLSLSHEREHAMAVVILASS